MYVACKAPLQICGSCPVGIGTLFLMKKEPSNTQANGRVSTYSQPLGSQEVSISRQVSLETLNSNLLGVQQG